jgi:hypothetical protein
MDLLGIRWGCGLESTLIIFGHETAQLSSFLHHPLTFSLLNNKYSSQHPVLEYSVFFSRPWSVQIQKLYRPISNTLYYAGIYLEETRISRENFSQQSKYELCNIQIGICAYNVTAAPILAEKNNKKLPGQTASGGNINRKRGRSFMTVFLELCSADNRWSAAVRRRFRKKKHCKKVSDS